MGFGVDSSRCSISGARGSSGWNEEEEEEEGRRIGGGGGGGGGGGSSIKQATISTVKPRSEPSDPSLPLLLSPTHRHTHTHTHMHIHTDEQTWAFSMEQDIDFYKHFSWLKKVNRQPCSNNETYQERLERLEGDKESLVLQVSVLTEQVEAQGEKIRDLEASLEEHHHKLISTEEMLQQELLNRTSLETQKLDLMDEVSYLKLKLVSMEEDHNHTDRDDKQHKAECVVNVISELQAQMRKFQQEITTRIQEQRALEGHPESTAHDVHDACYVLDHSPDADLCSSDAEDHGHHCSSGGDNALVNELHALKAKVDDLENEKSQYERKLKATKTEITELQQLLASKDTEIESLQNQLLSRGNTSSDSMERDLEMQRLKIGMESLLAANDEKDRHIDELTALLGQYRKCKDMMVLSQVCGDHLLCGSSDEDLSGSLRMRALPHKAHSDIVRSDLQMSSSRGTPQLLLPSMCLQNELDSRSTLRMLSSSLEELQSGSKHRHVMGQPVEPILENRLISDSSKYQTLPGKLSRLEQNGERERRSSPLQLSPDESEESEINLTKSEKTDESTLSDVSPMSSGMDSGQQSPVSPENRKNQKGIRKLWGKIRRTHSGGLPADGVDSNDFKRGGVRATAGPRLAGMGNRDSGRDMNNTPFSKWSCDQVCVWLEDYGLGQYVPMASQWVSSGQSLLLASPHDFEKELGMKHPLHRKKLQLALHSFTTRQIEKSAELDHIWVTRWLDDIGLPQYKGQFHEGRVDGRMLQYLTVNDLLILKVSSQLHHLSIKCAIHVLYVNKFNPNCLKRRPGDESQMLTSPSEVMQWSNHRVMEWLRSVDLAEYAPNLRGSGVHGGLIILEPRFNSDTLAMLLNIPPQKTLLRRHLNTNFNSLVGGQAQQEKQEYMESQSYTPLSTTAKVRPKKIGFSNFGQLRKKRPDNPSDYICPLESPKVLALLGDSQRPNSGVQERDTERREQMQITKGAVMQIEALSEGINHLTDSREKKRELDRVPLSPNTKERLILCIRETTL
ncbi:liprin-beta-2b isoform X2 [Pangasianodon hypophthalmus]|uniref:liprin-beta-2b isoform X2 n=1 Tax=Pangasianodon hypophthalmus TaxID=310915 RepID=UPI002306F568|nr:liprin-beta-2b isoform X2 [Pangasianodon hypophthalmus]